MIWMRRPPLVDPGVQVATTVRHTTMIRLRELATRQGLTLAAYVRQILVAAAERADG